MTRNERLQKLKVLQVIRKDGPLFKSADDCMIWIDNVAPLLKYDQQHYYEFCEHAKMVRITSLTVTTLMPHLYAMIGIVNQAIIELENNIEPIYEDQEEHDAMMRSFHGVPLANKIETLSDIELAELQSQLPPDSPGKIIIENEWQRRKSSEVPNPTPTPPADQTNNEFDWQRKILIYIAVGVIIVILGAFAIHLIKKHFGIPI